MLVKCPEDLGHHVAPRVYSQGLCLSKALLHSAALLLCVALSQSLPSSVPPTSIALWLVQGFSLFNCFYMVKITPGRCSRGHSKLTPTWPGEGWVRGPHTLFLQWKGAGIAWSLSPVTARTPSPAADIQRDAR
jgi:hypothetical protein